jgi:hypothetical protein
VVASIAALVLAVPVHVQAATFSCSGGDVSCLVVAINVANGNGERNTIFLDAGIYTLSAIDNSTDGPNGLPSVTGSIRLVGAGADNTIIEREASSPGFRLIHLAATGSLTLRWLTLRGGSPQVPHNGGAIFNNGGTLRITDSLVNGNAAQQGGGLYNAGGTVILTRSILSMNGTAGPLNGGGGIWNALGGTLAIRRSTIANNTGAGIGGGIFNDVGGDVTIRNSAVTSNMSFDPGIGGGIDNFGGTLTIVNSTVARNHSSRHAGGIDNGGSALIINSTITGNSGQTVGGISGNVGLQNTIVALNLGGFRSPPDCDSGTSYGNNLIGDTTGCAMTLQPSDLTGDPGLDAFSDDGTPGNGHHDLLPTSPAIGAGNDDVCPPRDQLGQPRYFSCDIGAIAFRQSQN